MSPSRVKAVLDGRHVGWKLLNDTVTDRTSDEARVVSESPRSASSKSELRSNVRFVQLLDNGFTVATENAAKGKVSGGGS